MPLLLVAVLGKIAGARRTVTALRTALISVGVVLLAAALGLVFFKAPGGIFLRLPGRAPALVYYSLLGVVAAFGFAEASLGYWAMPRDMDDWRVAIDEVVLSVSLFFLALVTALGGLSFLK
ncbi:hypothetical protein PVAP13_2KG122500 [Panicum virgatum]|uniref:Uncharacterized protein n=1 Tax=Panicum virgatum TaxID=38727 RepID=A0A8T0WCA7_PANVG|nr:hypothetical protein PVAP13_2KG122500 [Panicum virgatum]